MLGSVSQEFGNAYRLALAASALVAQPSSAALCKTSDQLADWQIDCMHDDDQPDADHSNPVDSPKPGIQVVCMGI
jgi:hypothetical protein